MSNQSYKILKVNIGRACLFEEVKNNFEEKYELTIDEYSIIGYRISYDSVKDNLYVTLYLKKTKDNKVNLTVEIESIIDDIFSERKDYMSFRNPPIEDWLNTKESWCRKLAKSVSDQYRLSFDEAMSEVYLSILKCYRKGIYMGSLGYIEVSVRNEVKMNYRSLKHKVSVFNCGNVISLSSPTYEDKDGNRVFVADVIGKCDDIQDRIEAEEELASVIRCLKKTFSDREIDQIIKNEQKYWPVNLLGKMRRWRNTHKYKGTL